MICTKLYFLLILIFFVGLEQTQAREGYGPGDQDWGYVEVRPKAHMFWWLHYTTAGVNYTDRPLLIWLQGGPAGSSSGEGNILMSGLVDENGNERSHSYVHKGNVLYIDNPVGAGYSYLEEGGSFSKDITELSQDFVTLWKSFLQVHPEFETVPLYILGESYGGKFAPAYAERLHKDIISGATRGNLQGVGLAYPATEQLTTMYYLPDTLFHGGILDQIEKKKFQDDVLDILSQCELGNWSNGSILTDKLLNNVLNNYNISFFRMTDTSSIDEGQFNQFNEFMDTVVSPILNLSVPFGRQRFTAANAIEDKLMSTANSVSYLLNFTDIKVTIYNGQLDWVVNSLGTFSWVNQLQAKNIQNWREAIRKPFYVNGIHEGHQKEFGKLAFYWIKRAGHRLPNDNPQAMDHILKRLIGY